MRKVIALALAAMLTSAFAASDVTGSATRNVFRDSFWNNVGSVAGEFGFAGTKSPILGFTVGGLLSSKAFELGYVTPMGSSVLLLNLGYTTSTTGTLDGSTSNGYDLNTVKTNNSATTNLLQASRDMDYANIGDYSINASYIVNAGIIMGTTSIGYSGTYADVVTKTGSSNNYAVVSTNNGVQVGGGTTTLAQALDRTGSSMSHTLTLCLDSFGPKFMADAKLGLNLFSGSFDQATATYSTVTTEYAVAKYHKSSETSNYSFNNVVGSAWQANTSPNTVTISQLRGTEISLAVDLYLNKATEDTFIVTPSASVYAYAPENYTLQYSTTRAYTTNNILTNEVATSNMAFFVGSRAKAGLTFDYKKIWGKESVVEFGLNPVVTLGVDSWSLTKSRTNTTTTFLQTNAATANSGIVNNYTEVQGSPTYNKAQSDLSLQAKLSPAVRIKILPKLRLLAGTTFTWTGTMSVANTAQAYGVAGAAIVPSSTVNLPYYKQTGTVASGTTAVNVEQTMATQTDRTTAVTWASTAAAGTLDMGLEFKPDEHLTISLLANTAAATGFKLDSFLGIVQPAMSVQAVYAF